MASYAPDALQGIEAKLPPEEYAQDVLRFGRLVRSIWPERWPLILAPDSNAVDEAWFGRFLDVLFANNESSLPMTPAAASAVDAAPKTSSATTASSSSPPDVQEWSTRGPVDYISHHMYPLGAGDSSRMLAKVTDPRKLDAALGDRLRLAARVILNRTSGISGSGPGAPGVGSVGQAQRGHLRLCVSETGGAYNSGQAGVTDAFGSSFW